VAELSLAHRPELVQQFWAALQAGQFISEAAQAVGTSRRTGRRLLAAAGGVRPRRGRDLQGRYLSFAEREEIAVGVAAGESVRAIAERIGRAPSTVSREIGRNSVRGRYRAFIAQVAATRRTARPKPAKLATDLVLRARVEADLARRRSPEQISSRLRRDFPNQPQMQVSPETIYQALYVQFRGALKQELTRCLRTGRALRHPSRKTGQRKNRIPNIRVLRCNACCRRTAQAMAWLCSAFSTARRDVVVHPEQVAGIVRRLGRHQPVVVRTV